LAKSIKPPAVLLVDDHPANLLALETVLEPLGFRLGTASSGTEALGRLLEDDYVLILMDVHMPGLDGYETVTLIRERQRCRDIPVIFLTAVYDQPEHTRRGYALGAPRQGARARDAVHARRTRRARAGRRGRANQGRVPRRGGT
jgi:CheY-like chemotaxis protein